MAPPARHLLSRRALLAGVALSGVAALTGGAMPRKAYASAAPLPRWLNAYGGDGPERVYGVAAFDSRGSVVFHTPLPDRAHAVMPHPTKREAVVMARRPGTWLGVLNLESGAVAQTQAVPADRRGTGHAVFNRNGSRLYVPEDDVPNEVGVISLVDSRDGYRRIGQLPGHGIGPHEILLLDNERTLAVANGGVLTHPDTGRVKLNLDTIDPSLTYVDIGTGALVEAVRLGEEYRNLGIRHIAALNNGAVAFGMQDEQPDGTIQPLVGLHRRGSDPVLLSAPDGVWSRFRGYIGSVASDGRIVAATSPRGGVAGFWDGDDGRWLGLVALRDVCGVAAVPGHGFVLTSGLGNIVITSGAANPGTESSLLAETPAYRWDNHANLWPG